MYFLLKTEENSLISAILKLFLHTQKHTKYIETENKIVSMNVSQTNIDKVNATITVSVDKVDYQEKVEKTLKDFRKRANIPGFRPGNVPLGMIKKMYGKSILADEINKLVGEALYKYIQENQLNILGEPLPNTEQQTIDFAKEENFSFVFDIALAPEVSLAFGKEDKITYYTIDVNDELVERQIQSYKQNYGKYETLENEAAKDTDLLKGVICELEGESPKENGIHVESGVLMPSYMKDKEEQAKFIGAKVGDKIIFNPGKAYEGNEAEIASFLQIEKDKISSLSPEFSFEIKEVTRYQEAELNQELFNKVFGEGSVSSEAEFKDKVKTLIQTQFAPDSDYKFLLDARSLLEHKVGKLELPEAFLKRWLLTSNKDKTQEIVDQEYPSIEKDLTFHLIKEQIIKANNLKVEEADIQEIAKQAARAQFAQYGMMSLPDQMLENYAQELLKNKESARNLADKAMETKIVEVLKKDLQVEEKTVSLEEFKQLFETPKSEE